MSSSIPNREDKSVIKPEDFAEAAKEAVKMGFNAIKFDLDQANDPNKYDKYNWTASPAEVQRMYDQMAAARAAVGPNIDICADMHVGGIITYIKNKCFSVGQLCTEIFSRQKGVIIFCGQFTVYTFIASSR